MLRDWVEKNVAPPGRLGYAFEWHILISGLHPQALNIKTLPFDNILIFIFFSNLNNKLIIVHLIILK